MKSLFSLVGQGWQFFRSHSLKKTFLAVMSRDAHPLIQFCGVLAVGTQVAFFALFSTWFPSHATSGLADAERGSNHMIANLLAFPISNLVAYFGNRIFVFTPGRHSPGKEFALFTGISILSFGAGMLMGPYLIKHYGIGKWAAECSFAVTSALVNFVCRKLLVFAK
jgi:putative flippase GtrA